MGGSEPKSLVYSFLLVPESQALSETYAFDMTPQETTEWYWPFLARHYLNPDFVNNESLCVKTFIRFMRSSYPDDMGGLTVAQSGDNIVHNVARGFITDFSF